MQLQYELIGFSNRAAEKFLEAVQKTMDKCREFSKKVLATYNRCQTSSKKRLDELPPHEEHLKQLHDRLQEYELSIQMIKILDDKVLKIVIDQVAVNNCRLEDQIRLLPARMANIKAQATKHEVTSDFWSHPTLIK